ncbi:uncharacterized protein PG998_009516 [Apiospora kogelbergensis]|uniref:Uncharacterized protein n=1 Tax=Apiospora kogelbergensis TaxID=1337665 RepID=A0AAW0R851_9PEZI
MEKHVPTGHEEMPPPYSVSPGDSLQPSRQSDPTSWASELYAHLSAVPDRIRQNRQLRNLQQVEADAWMADNINQNITEFLDRLGSQSFTPVVATLVIVPAAEVPKHATWSETDELKRRGEIGEVVRVEFSQNEKEKGGDQKKSDMLSSTGYTDQTWTEGGEFDDWGRAGSSSENVSRLWFKDENMARRLASYIELPEGLRITRAEYTSSVQEAVEQEIPVQKKSKGWGWGSGRRKNNASTEIITPTPSTASLEAGGPRGTVAGGDVAGSTGPGFYRPPSEEARMDVTAEQVVLRCRSEMGLLESMNGWAVVVKVKVQ